MLPRLRSHLVSARRRWQMFLYNQGFNPFTIPDEEQAVQRRLTMKEWAGVLQRASTKYLDTFRERPVLVKREDDESDVGGKKEPLITWKKEDVEEAKEAWKNTSKELPIDEAKKFAHSRFEIFKEATSQFTQGYKETLEEHVRKEKEEEQQQLQQQKQQQQQQQREQDPKR